MKFRPGEFAYFVFKYTDTFFEEKIEKQIVQILSCETFGYSIKTRDYNRLGSSIAFEEELTKLPYQNQTIVEILYG